MTRRAAVPPARHRWGLVLAGAVFVLAACGDDTTGAEAPAQAPATAAAPAVDSTPAAPTTTAAAPATEVTAPATEPAPSDAPDSAADAQALIDEILLTPDDLGDGWDDVGDELAMPHRADIARTLPECAPFAELVFEGGTGNLAARAKALSRQNGMILIYGVVFETAEQAAEMVAAVGSTDFDRCWADFNAAAIKAMPFGVTDAYYDPVEPPVIDVDADSVAVKYVKGTYTVGGSAAADSCLCVFAQVDRVVVALHSADIVLPDEVRTEAVQAGIDKARRVLAER